MDRSKFPQWLTDTDEGLHTPDGAGWRENFLTYMYDPTRNIGVYFHLARWAEAFDLWEEQFVVALPDDQFLVSKAFTAGDENGRIGCAGSTFDCVSPFEKWTFAFKGAARRVSGEQLRGEALTDGDHILVDLDLTAEAMGIPFDYGTGSLDEAWAKGHYEQHLRFEGRLDYQDSATELTGTGLRDHSWGARNTEPVGNTTFIQAQFPQSGRAFMIVSVPGTGPGPGLIYGNVAADDCIETIRVLGPVPTAQKFAETAQGYEVDIVTSAGSSTIAASIVSAIPMSFVGPSEIVMGSIGAPEAHHHFVEAFTRFEWDGEVGYGMTERSVDIRSD